MSDTIDIDAAHFSPKMLTADTHQYQVYFKMGKDSRRKPFQLSSRTVNPVSHYGTAAITVSRVCESNDTIIHTTYSVLD